MTSPLFSSMQQAIIDGDPEAAVDLANQALMQNIDPLEAINQGYLPGRLGRGVGKQIASPREGGA